MKTKVMLIDVGQSCDAWYYCSDGNVYYDSMYSYDICVGDFIDVKDYPRVSSFVNR